ncbi:glutathione S-transferase [Sphingomonas oleivorans]|uniref:Glutathione S-transferase n=1 Tax=Sphingomonas oleivorans TaxID=1735121 RepID=A0A2T5FZN8_9SPHN|nr:glutathione S-transferase family protein [Sphingomonas oleivorans]PTQ12174.1 glutathione S-transferase [Sphingomonas oleivorans]
MDPILFYGIPEGCSFGSIVALEWLGRPYRLCRIQMPETVSGDAYRRINLVGETPSLMTASGAIISESIAILAHIGAQAKGTDLAFEPGTAQFDRQNQMLAFLNSSFFHAFVPLWHVVEHGSEGAEKEVLTAIAKTKVEKAHRNLEAMLGGRDWLAGDRRSLADAYFIGIARWADFHKVIDRRDYPGLNSLYEKLESDPAVRFAHAIEREAPAQSRGGFAGYVHLDEALHLLKQPA